MGDYQAIGMLYTFEGKDYVVTAAAYDGYGYANISELGRTLLILLAVGLSLLAVVGWLLARAALSPIRSIVKEAEVITTSEISRRLPVKKREGRIGRTVHHVQCPAGASGSVVPLAEDVCQQCVP